MRFAFLTALTALLFIGTGCEGVLDGPRDPAIVPTGGGTANTGGGSATGGGVVEPPCTPGTATVTKLNRVSNHEYQQIISDVLGVPVPDSYFTRWTPIASVYGFDTMSESRIDGQGLTTQLETAERLVELIRTTPALTAHCPAPAQPQTPACTVKVGYSSRIDFSDSQDRDCWTYLDSAGTPMSFDNTRSVWRKMPDENALIWQTGMHPGSSVEPVLRWKGPLDGTVIFTGTFGDGDPGGGDGVTITLRRNNVQVWTRNIPNGSAPTTLNLTLPVSRNDLFDLVVGRNANPSYDTTSIDLALSYAPTPLKAGWTWNACISPLISRLASRSFRRPVRADELADYQQLFESQRQAAAAAGFAEPVDEALSAVIQAVVLSPNFVFKPELVPGGLDPNEAAFGTASRLSLFFRGSIADEELWMAAGTGALTTPQAVRTQAARLIDADAPRFTRNFGGQWLDFRDSSDVGPLTAALKAESSEVFREVLTTNLPADQLLSPGFTFVDPTLAYHYGLSYPSGGTGVQKVMTPMRGGLLSQGGFLIHTATGSEFGRPIHRGLWTLTRLLCRSLPRLDAATLQEISNSVDAIDRNLPLAEQMRLHRTSGTRCAGCHSLMDPIGLALEKYDRQGLWRDTYPNGAPIMNDLLFDGVTPVRDPNELAGAVENSPEFRACVARNLLTFALNRGPLTEELCVAKELAAPKNGAAPSLKDMTLEAWIKAQQLTGSAP
jgi:hypothetical protein